MAMERNANSVLAKLMGIERPSVPVKSHGRLRVLSENYLQNIALIAHRERSPLRFHEDEDEFTMAVDGHSQSEDIVQLSEGSSVNECHNLFAGNNNVGLSVNGGSTSVKTKIKGHRSQQFERFDLRSNTGSCSEFGHLSSLGSSSASAAKKQKLTKAWIEQAKSQCNMETTGFAHSVSKDCLEVDNGCFSPFKRIADLNPQNRKSHLRGTFSSLLNSSSEGRKRKVSPCVKNKGNQGRSIKCLYNSIESPTQDRTSARQIAKQVTSQVKHSIWHSFIDVSESGHRNARSSASEHEETMSSSSCLSSWDNEHGTSSSKPFKRSEIQDAWRTKKELFERWTGKSNREARTYCRNISAVRCRKPLTDEVNRWQVGAARYLSKPALLPSAWVPGSRTRDLNLERHWRLRLEKRENLQYDNSVEENMDHEVLMSTTLEPHGPKLSLGEYDIKRGLKTPNVPNNSDMLEEISSAPETFGERSTLSDVESPTYHEAFMTLSTTDDKHLGHHVSQEGSSCSAFDFGIAPPSMDNEEMIDEGNNKLGTYFKLQSGQLSGRASVCSLLEDRKSSFPELCLKHQAKDNASEPGSPVSSLEGPEAYRCWPKSSVEANQISSVPDFLDDNIHRVQVNLQPIDTISLESGSEGPEMVVSSDGDNEGGSMGWYPEDAQIMKLYGTAENRDFSYVVDVLSELGFPTLNLEVESETWRSQGYVLNPLVFDTLEKKYGKQTFWEKSERKLLFDRMNSGLMEIAWSLDPINVWRKPLAKRFGSTQNQELIEEELWAWLVKQEEESRQESSDKVCGGEAEWLELEAYTYLIAEEVESLLLDELCGVGEHGDSFLKACSCSCSCK